MGSQSRDRRALVEEVAGSGSLRHMGQMVLAGQEAQADPMVEDGIAAGSEVEEQSTVTASVRGLALGVAGCGSVGLVGLGAGGHAWGSAGVVRTKGDTAGAQVSECRTADWAVAWA